MFCCVVKIVYIFITIFFLLLFFPLLLFVFSFFLDREERAHFYGKPLMMSSAQRSKDNENVRVQWRMRTHAQPEEPRASTNASVELENMPVLWPANASGGCAQREQLAQVFISAFWSIRPALPLYSTTLSLPCLVSTWLCSSALNPRRRQKPAYMNNLFFFFFFGEWGPSFCALMIIGLISFFHRSHCSLLDLNLFGMHRMLALFVFPSPSHYSSSFSLLRFILCFCSGREIV